MKKIFPLALLAAIMFCNCSPYMYSFKKKDESVALNIIRSENKNGIFDFSKLTAQNTADESGRFAFAPAMIKPIAMAIFKISMALLDAERKRYTQDYSASATDFAFYKLVSDSDAYDCRGMDFAGFDINRTFKNKDGGTESACKISLAVDLDKPHEIANNSMFRLYLSGFDYKYSKAKIANLKKNEKKASLIIDINLKSTWLTAEGVMNQNKDIGRMRLQLKDIPMDPSDPEYDKYRKSIIGTKLEGFSFLVPRSFGHYLVSDNDGSHFQKVFGTGQFTLDVKVTETGKLTKMQEGVFMGVEMAQKNMPK